MLVLFKATIPPARNATKKARSARNEVHGNGWSSAAALKNKPA